MEGIGVGFELTFLDQSVLKGIKAIDQEKRFAMFRGYVAKVKSYYIIDIIILVCYSPPKNTHYQSLRY